MDHLEDAHLTSPSGCQYGARMRHALLLAFAAWLIAGCGIRRPATLGETDRTGVVGDNFISVSIALGSEEIVFRWRTDRCEDLDVPDVPARAVRRRGEIILVSGNAPRNYFSYGPDFDRLKRSCTPVLTSPDDWTAESYRNHWWISSVSQPDPGGPVRSPAQQGSEHGNMKSPLIRE